MVVSLYNDGRPGALQIFDKNSGSTIEGFLEDWAIQFSRLLQSGETLTWLVRKASYNRYEPCGVTDDPNIPFCTSPLDYIVRWIAWKFAVNVPTQPEENLKK